VKLGYRSHLIIKLACTFCVVIHGKSERLSKERIVIHFIASTRCVSNRRGSYRRRRGGSIKG
jgi:hypothetical protein